MHDLPHAHLINLSWDGFCLLRQLYILRAAGQIDTSFQVATYIFDDHHYLYVAGERHTRVSATALQELSDHAFTSNTETLQERMQKTLYANRRDLYLLQDWEAHDLFFAQPSITQLSALLWEALQPIMVRDVSIEALCVTLEQVATEQTVVKRRRLGTLLGALTPYVHVEPTAIGVALRFTGGFLSSDWL